MHSTHPNPRTENLANNARLSIGLLTATVIKPFIEQEVATTAHPLNEDTKPGGACYLKFKRQTSSLALTTQPLLLSTGL